MALLLMFLSKIHRIKRPHDIIAEQKKYYEQASSQCEYHEPRRRPVGKGSSALRMEDQKKAQAEYEACIARKAEEMRKAEAAAKP